MSCKSALYAANTTAQTLTAGNTVNFGTIVRKYGNNITIAGGNVLVQGAGYYDMDTNLTVTADGAGTGVITLYKDGAAIPGASVSFTAASGSIYAFTIPAMIRQVCCAESMITAAVSGIPMTVDNAAMTVQKI